MKLELKLNPFSAFPQFSVFPRQVFMVVFDNTKTQNKETHNGS